MSHATEDHTSLSYLVTAVDREGVTVQTGQGNTRMSWGLLHQCAVQDDQGLAQAYRSIRDIATKMAHEDKSLPIVLELRDSTNTGFRWELGARTVAGWLPLREMGLIHRDECGTMYRRVADQVRDDVRERLRARGYSDIRQEG